MTEKMKWYFLIAAALIVGALIAYFATNGFSSKGQAKSVLVDATSYNVTELKKNQFVDIFQKFSENCGPFNPAIENLKKSDSLEKDLELDLSSSFMTKEEFDLTISNLNNLTEYCVLRSKYLDTIGESNQNIDSTIYATDHGPCGNGLPASCCDGRWDFKCLKEVLWDYDWFLNKD